ncbi:MAG: hypothetical protein WCS37_17885 [Chloroflexota bacterium]|nr:hypothetical protein [Chloroflexota bacterium]
MFNSSSYISLIGKRSYAVGGCQLRLWHMGGEFELTHLPEADYTARPSEGGIESIITDGYRHRRQRGYF